jgi:hypothetical protein
MEDILKQSLKLLLSQSNMVIKVYYTILGGIYDAIYKVWWKWVSIWTEIYLAKCTEEYAIVSY